MLVRESRDFREGGFSLVSRLLLGVVISLESRDAVSVR